MRPLIWKRASAGTLSVLTYIVISSYAVCDTAQAQTVKDEALLLDKPSGNPQGSPVAAGTVVKIVERQGFWIRIEGGGRSGWIKASGLSFSSGSGGPIGIDTGRLGSGNIVSSSAARGLSAKDLLNGTPQMDGVAKMAHYTPNAAAVQTFASQGRVVALTQTVSLKPAEPPSPGVELPVRTEVKRDARGEVNKPTPKKDADDW